MTKRPLSDAWLVLAEILGIEMARKAAEIFRRHLDPAQSPWVTPDGIVTSQISASDLAIFSTILELANEAFGRIDVRPPDQRGADYLVGLLCVADCSEDICLRDLLDGFIQEPGKQPNQDPPPLLQARVESRPPQKASRPPGSAPRPHRRRPSRAARSGRPRGRR